MEENKSIPYYIGQVFSTYGVIVSIFIVLGLVIGDKTGDYLSLFAYESDGLSMSTLLQLLGLSVVIAVSKAIFFSDVIIKELKLYFRILLFIGTIVITILFLVVVFKWFPLNDVKAWVGFAVSFLVCTTVSVIATRLLESAENKRMEKALDNFNNVVKRDGSI